MNALETIIFTIYTSGDDAIASQIAYEEFLKLCAKRAYSFSVRMIRMASDVREAHVEVEDISSTDLVCVAFNSFVKVKPQFPTEE